MADKELFDIDFNSLSDTEPITMEEVNSEKVAEKPAEGDSTETSDTEEESSETPDNKPKEEDPKEVRELKHVNKENQR